MPRRWTSNSRIWARGKDGKRDPEIGAKLNAYAEEISRVEKEEE